MLKFIGGLVLLIVAIVLGAYGMAYMWNTLAPFVYEGAILLSPLQAYCLVIIYATISNKQIPKDEDDLTKQFIKIYVRIGLIYLTTWVLSLFI
jgi:hypothetical protein